MHAWEYLNEPAIAQADESLDQFNQQGALLLTWFDINPIIDEKLFVR